MKKTNTVKANSQPGNIYDAFVKSFFGRVVVFADFLRHYGNPNFVAEINLSKIKLAPTHYLGKNGDERIVDLVFQCPLKHGPRHLQSRFFAVKGRENTFLYCLYCLILVSFRTLQAT
jgi:hypothetical protein